MSEMTDPLVGKLVLDKSVDWFEGTIDWLGGAIGITVCKDENGSTADALRTAQALIEHMQQWAAKVNDYAVSELLELKNDVWLEEDEEPISRDGFLERMRLTSITVHPAGGFEFWHDDGDLFWGHVIRVAGSLDKGLSDAHIAG